MRGIHEPDEQGFIPSIFNYCDRRCERCRFVRQCRVGIIDVDDMDENREAGDGKVEDYEERLRKVMGMPEGDDEDEDDDGEVEKSGFSLDINEDYEPDPEYEKEQETMRSTVEEHPITLLGMEYSDAVSEWMEPREKQLEAKGISLHRGMELGISAALRTPDALVLSEAFDEMLWFQHMFHIKCQRALLGKLEGREIEYDWDPLQSDWNGTAKLAIQIVERCIAAWSTIAELMPEEADGVKGMIPHLRKCEALLREEFPETEKFIRPGFDA